MFTFSHFSVVCYHWQENVLLDIENFEYENVSRSSRCKTHKGTDVVNKLCLSDFQCLSSTVLAAGKFVCENLLKTLEEMSGGERQSIPLVKLVLISRGMFRLG
jgi:ABC-type iron transport system FetAB ATPase subunit